METKTKAVKSTESLAAEIREEGWCLIEDVVPEDRIGPIRDELITIGQGEPDNKPFTRVTDGLTIYCASSINYIPSFTEYLADPRMTALIEYLFGPHFRVCATSTTNNIPHSDRKEWHGDQPFAGNYAGHIESPYTDTVLMTITTIWMLDPFKEENGATHLVPRSHKRDTNPSYGEKPSFEPFPDEIQVTGSAGSVLAFDSRMWHAGGANNTDEPRVSMVARYAPWWMNQNIYLPGSTEQKIVNDDPRQRLIQYPPMPLDVYESLPEIAKPLFRHAVRM